MVASIAAAAAALLLLLRVLRLTGKPAAPRPKADWKACCPSPPPQASSAPVAGAAAKKRGGLLASFVRSIGVGVVGTGALTREDIAPALDTLRKQLMERNVAEEIAGK